MSEHLLLAAIEALKSGNKRKAAQFAYSASIRLSEEVNNPPCPKCGRRWCGIMITQACIYIAAAIRDLQEKPI